MGEEIPQIAAQRIFSGEGKEEEGTAGDPKGGRTLSASLKGFG